MPFRDREQAGEYLAEALAPWRGAQPLVVAIPRGAVPMARIVADRLGGELDIVLTRKLRAPGSPEFAIGAVDETGWTYIADYAGQAGAEPRYIEHEVSTQMQTIRERRARYTPGRAPIDARGRVVIVVDDGLATGATMIAALHAMRARKPRRLICAVPVASADALAAVQPYTDEVVCLEAPDYFVAVGQAYRHFPQVDDDEVIAILRNAAGVPNALAQ